MFTWCLLSAIQLSTGAGQPWKPQEEVSEGRACLCEFVAAETESKMRKDLWLCSAVIGDLKECIQSNARPPPDLSDQELKKQQ